MWDLPSSCPYKAWKKSLFTLNPSGWHDLQTLYQKPKMIERHHLHCILQSKNESKKKGWIYQSGWAFNMLDLWHCFLSWLWGRKQTESKRTEKKNRLNVWYVCAVLSKLPSIIGWTHTYTLKNTHAYALLELLFRNRNMWCKLHNSTTGNTSHTQQPTNKQNSWEDNCLIILWSYWTLGNCLGILISIRNWAASLS